MFLEIVRLFPGSWITTANKLRWRSRFVNQFLHRTAPLLRNRDSVIKRGVGRGLKFNVGDSHGGCIFGTHEPEVQNVFAGILRPGMVVYDIGANVGFYSMIAARLVGAGGQVRCFEPLSRNARGILHNASLNGFGHVHVNQIAVGAHDGLVGFSLSSFATFGRFSELGAPDGHTGNTSVPVRSLDSLISSGLPSPDFIKLDVEGAETDVLAGASDTVANARPVMLIELHGTNAPVASLLETYGYDVHVLGSRIGILEAHWNSHVIAVPRERKDLSATVSALTDPSSVR